MKQELLIALMVTTSLNYAMNDAPRRSKRLAAKAPIDYRTLAGAQHQLEAARDTQFERFCDDFWPAFADDEYLEHLVESVQEYYYLHHFAHLAPEATQMVLNKVYGRYMAQFKTLKNRALAKFIRQSRPITDQTVQAIEQQLDAMWQDLPELFDSKRFVVSSWQHDPNKRGMDDQADYIADEYVGYLTDEARAMFDQIMQQ